VPIAPENVDPRPTVPFLHGGATPHMSVTCPSATFADRRACPSFYFHNLFYCDSYRSSIRGTPPLPLFSPTVSSWNLLPFLAGRSWGFLDYRKKKLCVILPVGQRGSFFLPPPPYLLNITAAQSSSLKYPFPLRSHLRELLYFLDPLPPKTYPSCQRHLRDKGLPFFSTTRLALCALCCENK